MDATILKSIDRHLCVIEDAQNRDVIVEVVRLDGSLATPATPFVNFVGGAAGNTYNIPPDFKSVVFAWLPDTVEGAILDINDVGYKAGVSDPSAGYVGILPQLENSGGIENHPFTLDITAGAGAFVELIVTR